MSPSETPWSPFRGLKNGGKGTEMLVLGHRCTECGTVITKGERTYGNHGVAGGDGLRRWTRFDGSTTMNQTFRHVECPSG